MKGCAKTKMMWTDTVIKQSGPASGSSLSSRR